MYCHESSVPAWTLLFYFLIWQVKVQGFAAAKCLVHLGFAAFCFCGNSILMFSPSLDVGGKWRSQGKTLQTEEKAPSPHCSWWKMINGGNMSFGLKRKKMSQISGHLERAALATPLACPWQLLEQHHSCCFFLNFPSLSYDTSSAQHTVCNWQSVIQCGQWKEFRRIPTFFKDNTLSIFETWEKMFSSCNY